MIIISTFEQYHTLTKFSLGRLTERYVQEKSLRFLEDYYRNFYNLSSIFSKCEVRTRINHKGFGRADGLLCFNSTKQENHVVSLEAKSHKTLGSLKPYWNNKRYGILFFLVLFITSLASVYLTYNLAWYWILGITILSSIIMVMFFFIIITQTEPAYLKKLDVVEQVKRYPANEQWIAISKDSLNLSATKKNNFYNQSNDENLLSICEKNGMGLLLVSNQRIYIKLKPKFKHGKFLRKYTIEKKIKELIF